MRNQITSVAAAILLMNNAEVTEARKQLVDGYEQRVKTRHDPFVASETCEDLCVFGANDGEFKNFWCFTFTEPVLRLGWEYNQDAETSEESTPNKHLRFDLILYAEAHLQVTSTLDIYRFYYNQAMFEIPQIDFKIDLGTIITEFGYWCPHISWSRTAFGINSTYRQEYMNCSKVFVKNPWDIEGVWTGKYAKYFDECHRSQADSATGDDP